MEYSIQELSRLSGVTTRTLRWYDQIGLLKPSRVAESGYRYYGGAEVDRRRTFSITGPSGWSWPRSRNVWTIPPLTVWLPCETTWPHWRQNGSGWNSSSGR